MKFQIYFKISAENSLEMPLDIRKDSMNKNKASTYIFIQALNLRYVIGKFLVYFEKDFTIHGGSNDFAVIVMSIICRDVKGFLCQTFIPVLVMGLSLLLLLSQPTIYPSLTITPATLNLPSPFLPAQVPYNSCPPGFISLKNE